jgi:hypothetical protein
MKAKIVFTTVTQLALWKCEVTGQLSDGAWENSVPHNHWKFWCKSEASVGDKPGITLGDEGGPERTKYNVVGLMNMKWHDDEMARMGTADPYVLRGRMLQIAHMALAFEALGRAPDLNVCRHAEYMPAEFYSFQASKKSGIWKHDFVAESLKDVDEALAAEFYKMRQRYGVDDLKRDLTAISEVMRSDTTR